MGPFADADGHDAPWLIDELVPGEAAVIDDIVVRFEDAVREPVVAHELPDVFDRVEFRTSWRQRHQGDVWRNDQFGRSMPSGLIENDHGMCAWRDVKGDFLEVHRHRLAVAGRHDDACRLALQRADRSEDPGRGSALISWDARPGAALGPAPGQFGLLADPRLVLPPQFYGRSLGQACGDTCKAGSEAFLKSAISSVFWPL